MTGTISQTLPTPVERSLNSVTESTSCFSPCTYWDLCTLLLRTASRGLEDQAQVVLNSNM